MTDVLESGQSVHQRICGIVHSNRRAKWQEIDLQYGQVCAARIRQGLESDALHRATRGHKLHGEARLDFSQESVNNTELTQQDLFFWRDSIEDADGRT